MANKTLLAHAPSFKQRQDFTIAGNWAQGETITFKIGGIEFVVTVGATVTVAEIANIIVQAWNNATMNSGSSLPEVTGSGTSGGARYIPQFDKLIASDVSAGVFRLTGRNAGESVLFDANPTTTSAAGTITPGTLTPATGRNWLDNADNFSPNGALASDDVLIMAAGSSPSQDITEGLDLDPIQLAAVHKYATFSAHVGLPKLNTEFSDRPYSEHRQRLVKTVHDAAVGETVFSLEMGLGRGSSRFFWDCSNGKFIANIYGKGQRLDDVPCIQIVGTHADNVVNNLNGDYACGLYPEDATTLKELNTGNGQGSQAETTCGPYANLTNCTIIVGGGKLTTNSALCTATGSVRLVEGEVIHQAGDVKDLTIEGGEGTAWRQRCGGDLLGTMTIRGGKFDASQNFDTLTPAAAIEVFAGAALDDSNRTLAVGTEIHLNGCDLDEVKLKLGKGRTIRIVG